ncbi:TIR domain-containing protein [Streptacidiphilus sp. N1-12]|uniref:TIR domain-containing protein n=2 Tax=Streptacidiphilus alkalitolerans TaxID=3342712 RepID=A0ABV6VFA1_9ACTN
MASSVTPSESAGEVLLGREDSRADFYISYAEVDREWAEWIAWNLEEGGFSTILKQWDFRPGTNVILEIQRAAQHSIRTILVMSSAYEIELTAAHWGPAFNEDRGGRFGAMLPVRVENVRLAGVIADLISVDFIGVDEETARRRLLEAAKGTRQKPLTAPSFPGRLRTANAALNVPASASATRAEALIADVVEKLNLHSIPQLAHQWMLEDQLDSGGWGRSQKSLMASFGRVPLTDLEFNEGGLYSTYSALVALRAHEADDAAFLLTDAAQRALKYFIERQAADGGFGRHVESVSGREIHQSIRHTAFAVSSIMMLEGPRRAVDLGIKFLKQHVSNAHWSDEASPSTAPAALLALETGGGITFDDETVELLIQELVEGAVTSVRAPLWSPYGAYPQMLFDTALSTIDLLPNPTPPPLLSTVTRAILHIVSFERDGGIPYHPGSELPDIGLSCLLLSILLRRLLLDDDLSYQVRSKMEKVARSTADFITNSWLEERFWKHTYTSTIQGILRVGVS